MTIETKYNHGDEVWFMYNNSPTKATVIDFSIQCQYAGGSGAHWGGSTFPIIITHHFILKDQKSVTRDEKNCYQSKEELLKSL